MSREDLPADTARWSMEQILSGEATAAQIAAFGSLLRAKGESVVEIDALVDTMLTHATPFHSDQKAVVDVVGTGGDRSGSVNISTMAALVVAAAGVPVVKHGNRAASSRAGSADVVEALGIPLDLPAERVAEVLDETGITFCFAPVFHPAMRFAGPPRRELGVATTFNLLGPLANPARPTAMALGVAAAPVAPLMASVLASRDVSALVVRGDDGLDELTTTTTSQVWRVRGGLVEKHTLDPQDLGVAPVDAASLRGGDAAENADVVRRLVAGEPGPVRDVVTLNAAAALVAHLEDGKRGDAEPSSGDLGETMRSAMAVASAALDDGSAERLLQRWVATARS